MADARRKVLIFEDNPNIQTILNFYFLKRGLDSIISDSGDDAVALIREHDPALVLMDLIMPGTDGVEACKNIRDAGLRIPIIMLTSKAFNDDRERALASGADAYLLKPFNPAELDATVRRLLA